MAPSTVPDTQPLINKDYLWNENPHGASRANRTSARSQAQGPGAAEPAWKVMGVWTLHPIIPRTDPASFHPKRQTPPIHSQDSCVSAGGKTNGQTTLLPRNLLCPGLNDGGHVSSGFCHEATDPQDSLNPTAAASQAKPRLPTWTSRAAGTNRL